MKIEDIKPKYIVLHEMFDDFARDSENVDYKKEDYVSQVIQVTSVIYWLNIESVWGFAGFTWDVYEDYGHFNAVTFDFSVIPRVPDPERIKRLLTNFFSSMNAQTITFLDSGWSSITQVDAIQNNNKSLILHNDTITTELRCDYKYTDEDLSSLNGTFLELTNPAADIQFTRVSSISGRTAPIVTPTSYFILHKDSPKIPITDTNRLCMIKYDEEDDRFSLLDRFYDNGKDSWWSNITFVTPSNKFEVCPFYKLYNNIPMLYYKDNGDYRELEFNDYKFSQPFYEYRNMLDLVVNFKVPELSTNVSQRQLQFAKYIPIKNLSFINFEELSSDKNIRLYNYPNVAITPQLNNLDLLDNLQLDKIFEDAELGKLNVGATIAVKDVRITNVLLIYGIYYIPIDKQITINLHNQNINLEQLFIKDDNNTFTWIDTSTDMINFPYKFINCENSYINANIAPTFYTSDNTDEHLQVNSASNGHYLMPESCTCRHLACDGYFSLNEHPVFNVKGYSGTYHITVLDADPSKEIQPAFNITLDDDTYYVNLNEHYSNNGYRAFLDQYPADTFNIYTINIVTDHYKEVLCMTNCFSNASGWIMSDFKNYTNIKVTSPAIFCNPAGIEQDADNIIFDRNWHYIYNVTLTIYTVQSNIHQFVNAVDTKVCTKSCSLSIPHENYIQLTSEELNKLITAGYQLIDFII